MVNDDRAMVNNDHAMWAYATEGRLEHNDGAEARRRVGKFERRRYDVAAQGE